jgi:hypothetical protein
MMDKNELIEKLQQLSELYETEADKYIGPAKAFYMGKRLALHEVMLWIIDDEELSVRMMKPQDGVFTKIMQAENHWVKIQEILEED